MQFFAKSSLFATLLLSTLSLAQMPVAPTSGTPENTTGALGDAKTYTEDPAGKSFVADFKGTKLSGTVKFSPQSDKNGVKVEVALSGFPAEGGPFGYHIHDQPVPADGNCTGTRAHLDPYVRGQKILCDPTRPASCEVGDLAGKHGRIPADVRNGTFTQTYVDAYITLNLGQGAYIGNRSIVVHTLDTKRYACANITVLVAKDKTPITSNSAGNIKPVMGWAAAAAMGLTVLFV